MTRKTKLTWSSIFIAFVLAGIAFGANGPQPAVGLYWYDNADPTIGGGMAAPPNQLLVRTDAPSLYYKSGTTNTAWTKIGSGTSSGGTVTSVACSTGLACTPSPIVASGSIAVNLTPTTCSAGAAEISTAANGTSSCAAFVNAAGTGLALTGSSLAVNLTTTTCSAGSAITAIAANGTGTCSSAGFTTVQSVYYGDGTDNTCAFDGIAGTVCGGTLSGSVYTLQRDIAANNMSVSAGVTVTTDNWRIFVFNGLSGGGAGATISASGVTAVGRLGGNGGGRNTHFYPACVTSGGSGANGTGAGATGGAIGSAIPQWPAQGTTAAGAAGAGHGQGGGGGTAAGDLGGGGGSIANPSVNQGYFTAVSAFAGKPDGNGSTWSLCGTGGGGGGTDGGSSTGGGGGGGGGIVFVGANQCSGTLLLTAAGGNGGVGTLVDGTGLGGGGGGGGGIVTFIYSHRAAGCTTSAAGGTGHAGLGAGGTGGNGSSGTVQLYNLSGDGS